MTPETMENVRRHLRLPGFIWAPKVPLASAMSYCPNGVSDAIASLCDRHERAERLVNDAMDLLWDVWSRQEIPPSELMEKIGAFVTTHDKRERPNINAQEPPNV